MRFIITNKKISEAPGGLAKDLRSHEIDGMQVFLEQEQEPEVLYGNYLFHDGYLRDINKEVDDLQGQKTSAAREISRTWPLSENITGSFSAALVCPKQDQVILCTDQVGLYPLYYYRHKDSFFVSNSIVLMGAFADGEFDEAGIAQRCLGPELENIGSRTILKNCKRLLPGECLRFDLQGNLISKEYDNRLFDNISELHQDHDLWKSYWAYYKKEVEYCVNYSEEVNIALSGGIDSRVVLGAVPENKKLNCYTFGDPANYESKVASKLAHIKKANFISCYRPAVYFPDPELLKQYTLKTEAVQLCSWLEITESVDIQRRRPLLLGELCEALPARKIRKFSSRTFRQENFLKYYIQSKDYEFEKTTDANVQEWKKETRRRFMIYYHERQLSKLALKATKEELLRALNDNFEEIFSRIDAHKLPFIELYDELFSWYTYTRMRLSKQLLVAGSKFDAFSPAMSLQVLRKTSNLHPNIRLNYRFAKKLFRNHKELKELNRVPTSQAPLIPQNFPDLFKFAMWGFRSKADQAITKKMIKSKDASRPYRLFKSVNWAQVYQHPEMEKNLRAYFENNHLGEGYFKTIFGQAVQRKKLEQWPFANMNIINAASLNMELDLIKELKAKDAE